MSLSRCFEPAELLSALDEHVQPTQVKRIADHLEHCQDCRRTMQTLAIGKEVSPARFEQQLQQLGSDPRFRERGAERLGSGQHAIKLLNPTDDPEMIGRLGRFEVSAFIGNGAAGFVFKGFDRSLHRPVALKLLSPTIAHLATARKRFHREGRAIALVRDPHVVDVYGVDDHNELPFLVMQYVSGESLQTRIARVGEMSTEEVTRIGLQVAKGLAAAHAQGIVHRDIKPSNILMEFGSDRAIVSDFGLAQVSDDAAMTKTGLLAGTPQFMAPEQAEGKSLDERADLFSLGCVMYACCTGQAPFVGESILNVLKSVAEAQPKPVRELNPQIAPWLEALVQKLMAKLPGERFQSASQVAQALSEELAFAQSTQQIPHPHRSWWRAESRPPVKQRITISLLGFALLGITTLAFLFPKWIQPNGAQDSQLARTEPLFEPTTAELNLDRAKAAYDLSYETHVQEASLSGDMQESIDRHLKALQLGYDPARSSFHIARAYALEGRGEEAFEWLKAAMSCGFCDSEAFKTNRDLRRIRGDERYTQYLEQIIASESKLDDIKTTYFINADYAAALDLAKQRLERWPRDEFTQLLIAGAMTEIAFHDASQISMAKIWNERIRTSVRFANYGNYNLGCLALMEGQLQRAFDYLHYAVSTGFTDLDHLTNDPMLGELTSDPRYPQLIRRFELSEPAN